MSTAPPNKKFKQTDPSSTKQTDPEPGEMSQATDNVQGKKEQKYTLRFCFDSDPDPVCVSCNTSMTVLDALNTSNTFRVNKNVNDMKKEVVILRADGAAVKTDFPCCLIEKDEIITITFIKKEKKACAVQKTQARPLSSRMELVTFYIKTTEKENMIYTMKNNELRNTADYVCVYAFKGEEVETALKRDGRFIDKNFQKHCVLILETKGRTKRVHQLRYEMSNPVECLDKKTFQIIIIDDSWPDTQKKQTNVNTESDVASAADSAQNDPGQHPIITEQKQTHHNTESSTSLSIIPDSTEILQILRDQHKNDLETLKRQKNLRDNCQVQAVYRAEYDKSVQRSSEMYIIKKLGKLSESVCQIRVEGCAIGTAFLLFGQFILTNAHVVRECFESPDKLSSTKKLEAAFDFEHLDSKVKLVPVKKQLAAYCYIMDANKCRLNFALLELDAVDEITGRPELLHCYSPGPPSKRGGICIVGHPGGGVKKMDPCFIIERENVQEAAEKHISENASFIQVMTQRSFEDRWDMYKNQINYNSCFFHGSSGSPVFDEDCKLIGVHTGGYVYREGDKIRSIMEYAYSMQPILDMIRAQARIRGLHEIVSALEEYRYNVHENASESE